MKVLVAVDDSAFSAYVLRAVIAQFRTEDTEIRLIHVVQPITPVSPPQMAPGYAPELEYEKQEAQKLVEQCSGQLRQAGFKVKADVDLGDIRERIIDSAAEWQADLIVIGSHGQKNLARFLLGSVAEFVARHAKCSVEIIRCPMAA